MNHNTFFFFFLNPFPGNIQPNTPKIFIPKLNGYPFILSLFPTENKKKKIKSYVAVR